MPIAPQPSEDTSNIFDLVWYDADYNPQNGRPDHGAWWPRNPYGRDVVPNDGQLYRTATPLLGPYDASDPAILRQHAYWLAAMGARGIIVDWTNSNFTTLPVYSQGIANTTRALLAEWSQHTAYHPRLHVVIAIRLQTDPRDTAVLLEHVAALYATYSACVVRLNNGTPTSTRPLLLIFTDFRPIDAWRMAPQWTDERFDIRFTNGYLVQRGLTVPLGPGALAKVVNDLPYWNFVENTPDPTQPQAYQTVIRNFVVEGVERTEQSAAWVTLHRGGMTWDGISADTFGRSLAPFASLAPQVLVLNRWNYAMGWYAEPQEGLSTDTATMLEPSEEYGYRLFIQATQALARIRGRTPVPLGPLSPIWRHDDGTVQCVQAGWPLEVQVATYATRHRVPWQMVRPVEGIFVIAPPCETSYWWARTRNAFEEGPWVPLGKAAGATTS